MEGAMIACRRLGFADPHPGAQACVTREFTAAGEARDVSSPRSSISFSRTSVLYCVTVISLRSVARGSARRCRP
jgi:hypothetical protein